MLPLPVSPFEALCITPSAPPRGRHSSCLLSCLPVEPSFSKIVLDYRIPLTAKVADMADKATALGKLTNATIIGSNKLKDAYAFLPQTGGKFNMVTLKINDKSIFQPDKTNKKNDQVGFRRNDIVPNYDPSKLEVGKKTYHHSFIFDKSLNNKHGTHMYDIHHGTPFDAKNTDGKASADANKIRVRDINFETLSLRVLHSVGDEKLAEVVKSTVITPKNPKVVNVAKTGEWHIQMIKEPLPNPTDKLEERSDVPHKGIQEKGIKEQITMLRNFIEDTTTDAGSTDPDGEPATGGTGFSVKTS
ncbi:hypothetical protein PSTT_03372 [Puccinia striiformis]|uniref:Glycoside hydrolase 131 catalytic N-terminal domain-containing protein n=1 Tax=Puccinia striiformis TaxID=27350 RepID=A0A2S4VWM7_9BASI|nr:hypothetical protein PSTT_03372 [Puccinia striiformis]